MVIYHRPIHICMNLKTSVTACQSHPACSFSSALSLTHIIYAPPFPFVLENMIEATIWPPTDLLAFLDSPHQPGKPHFASLSQDDIHALELIAMALSLLHVLQYNVPVCRLPSYNITCHPQPSDNDHNASGII